MPGILQSRLLRLIQAAEVFVLRDRRLYEDVHRICGQVNMRRLSPEDGILHIAAMLETRAFPQYHPAEKTIIEERTLYDLTHRRNTIERERIRAKRAGGQYHSPKRNMDVPPLFEEAPPPPVVKRSLDEDEALHRAMTEWAQEDLSDMDPVARANLEEARRKRREEAEKTLTIEDEEGSQP